eukprot:329251-Rhodomonas_salina.1
MCVHHQTTKQSAKGVCSPVTRWSRGGWRCVLSAPLQTPPMPPPRNLTAAHKNTRIAERRERISSEEGKERGARREERGEQRERREKSEERGKTGASAERGERGGRREGGARGGRLR